MIDHLVHRHAPHHDDMVEDVDVTVVIVDVDIDDIHHHQHRDHLTVHHHHQIVRVHLQADHVHRVRHHVHHRHPVIDIDVVEIEQDTAVEVHLDRLHDIVHPHHVLPIRLVHHEVPEVDRDQDEDRHVDVKSIRIIKDVAVVVQINGAEVEVVVVLEEIHYQLVDKFHQMTIHVDHHQIEMASNTMEIHRRRQRKSYPLINHQELYLLYNRNQRRIRMICQVKQTEISAVQRAMKRSRLKQLF